MRLEPLSRRLSILLASLEAMPRGHVAAIVVAFILIIGVVDSLTGQTASLTFFYLIPVIVGTWCLGRRAGVQLAVAAVVVWGVADRVGPFAMPRRPVLYWNDATLLAVFVLAVVIVSRLRLVRDRENALLAEVQRRLLPDNIASLESCEVAARWHPAGIVGGDYYDAIPIDGGGLALCIADVSGKGLPAALVMSNVQAAVRVLAHDSHSPGALLAHINQLMLSNTRLGTFVTMFVCILDASARRLVFANAGHNPPILARHDGSVVRLTEGGPVLGFFDSAAYEEGSLEVASGDRVVLFTDGVSEHGIDAGEAFGEDRLVTTVLAHREKGSGALCDAIVDAAVAHSGNAFEDDLTLLIAAIR